MRIDGRETDFELEGGTFRMDGNPAKSASLLEVEPGIYSVLVDGQSFEARIDPREGRLFVEIRGSRFEVEVRDPRETGRRSRGLHREGRQQVTSPMPGKVVRRLVSEGDEVAAGQGLIVVEAMKMQNELKAPQAGKVISFTAREGATVAAGEVLAVIE